MSDAVYYYMPLFKQGVSVQFGQNGSPKSNGYRIKFLKKATENSARKTAEYMLGMTTS